MQDKTKWGVKEVAAHTHLSKKTIYNLVFTKKIPFERVSERKVVFCKEDIDRWLDQRIEKTLEVKRKKQEEFGQQEISKSGSLVSILGDSEEKTFAEFKTSGESDGIANSKKRIDRQPAFKRRTFQNFFVIAVLFGMGWLGRTLFEGQKGISSAFPEIKKKEIVDIKSLLENSNIGDIQINDSELERDKVNIKLNNISGMVLESEVNSSPVQSLLVNILKNQQGDLAARSKAIDILEPHLKNDDVREALIKTIENDSNPSIRMKAASVLGKTAKMKDVKGALLKILKEDGNEAVRFKALEILEGIVDSEIIGVLKSLNRNEKDESIRHRSDLILKRYDIEKNFNKG